VELGGFRFDFDRMGRISVDENALPVTVKRLRGKLEDNPSGLNT
jgi:DNA-binding response OmpR family regulator